jgi:hypothetical protein
VGWPSPETHSGTCEEGEVGSHQAGIHRPQDSGVWKTSWNLCQRHPQQRQPHWPDTDAIPCMEDQPHGKDRPTEKPRQLQERYILGFNYSLLMDPSKCVV